MFVACVRNISKQAQNKQISHLACPRANLLGLCSKVLAVYRPLVGNKNPTHLWISVFELMDCHVLRQGSKMGLGLSGFESAVRKHERHTAKKPKTWLGQMGNPLCRGVLKSLHHLVLLRSVMQPFQSYLLITHLIRCEQWPRPRSMLEVCLLPLGVTKVPCHSW